MHVMKGYAMNVPIYNMFRSLRQGIRAFDHQDKHQLTLLIDDEVARQMTVRAELAGLSIEELGVEILSEAVLQIEQQQNLEKWETLTQREQEVAALACLNLSYQEIAQRLHIETGTVHTHLKSVYSKMEVTGKQHLAALLREWDFGGYLDSFSASQSAES